MRVAPRPPYCFGQANPNHPLAPHFSCHLRAHATASSGCSASSRSTVHSGGRFCLIKLLTSWRKASSLGERLRSTVRSPPERNGTACGVADRRPDYALEIVETI